MIVGFTLNQFKGAFFDKALVEGKIDRQTFVVMSRFGAYVRRDARRSFRRSSAKGPQPGSPPVNQTGKLKGSILFAWDESARSVIVGPFLFPRQRQDVPAPAALEYGGSVNRRRKGKSQSATYREFPYMRPALARNLPVLPRLWRDTIR